MPKKATIPAGGVDYVLSARAADGNGFVNSPGPSSFLQVPDGESPAPKHAIDRVQWYQAVRTAAEWVNEDKQPRGDVLFIVHGYNVSIDDVITRHRLLRDDLRDLGYKGTLVSFDWPCENNALAYLSDRHLAKMTALQLVSDGIVYLSKAQSPDCTINVHVIAHSTGAYVVREAFDDADDTKLQNGAWKISQLVFVAGDVSSDSMSGVDSAASSVYGHCVRLTNYWNRHDQVLDISNVKRAGIAPRVGRIGLPAGAPANAVNVDCTGYYGLLDSDKAVFKADQPKPVDGVRCHSWYFGNKVLARDLFNTLVGIDRVINPTRGTAADGRLVLQR